VECRREPASASASVYMAEVVVLAEGGVLMWDKARAAGHDKMLCRVEAILEEGGVLILNRLHASVISDLHPAFPQRRGLRQPMPRLVRRWQLVGGRRSGGAWHRVRGAAPARHPLVRRPLLHNGL
jgi:hypothetical protein